jgi:Integrase core domain
MVDRFLLWLGAGVVAAGMSPAMLTGAGFAAADTEPASDAGGASTSESSKSPGAKKDSETRRCACVRDHDRCTDGCGPRSDSVNGSPQASSPQSEPSAAAYDNALAETINGLYKTELIKPGKPWRTIEDVELAAAKWVHWFNHRRLYEYCGDISPAELEGAYYAQHRRSAAG